MKKEFLSRPITKAYYDNYDRIFGKKKVDLRRAADVATITDLPWFNEAEGTFYGGAITFREWKEINKKANPPVVVKK